MGPIREILHSILSTMCGGEDNVQGRHDAVESFMDRRGRLLSMVPLIVVLAVASTDILAAVWTAFGVQLFLSLMDWYRSRYNPTVAFPNIINTCLLLAYTLCVILVYVLIPPLRSVYVGPIVVTTVFGGMLLSVLFQNPFTLQVSAPKVDEDTRRSVQFYRFNQIVSLFWVFVMGVAMICIWCSTLFASNSPGQIVLGIVMPILCPVFGHLATPYLVDYLKSKAKNTKKDEEAESLLERA